MNYRIIYSKYAEADIKNLVFVIVEKYKAPITAGKYVQKLYNDIRFLEKTPETLPVQTKSSLLKYGRNVRRLNSQKMAVIYTVHGDTVYIHRIIRASMITGL